MDKINWKKCINIITVIYVSIAYWSIPLKFIGYANEYQYGYPHYIFNVLSVVTLAISIYATSVLDIKE